MSCGIYIIGRPLVIVNDIATMTSVCGRNKQTDVLEFVFQKVGVVLVDILFNFPAG